MKEGCRFFSPLRKISVLFYLLVLIRGLTAPGVLFPQSGPEDSIFAPFVSRLSAETKNNLVRLSWQDSQDARGPVYIFRSSQPFRAGPLSGDLKPVEVPYGTQSYVDETERGGTVYYFAAASDGQGRRYDVFIPYSNTIPVNTAGSSGDTFTPAPAAETEHPIRPGESGIFGIEAKVEGEGIIISYRFADGNKNTILYRSVQPLRTTADLLRAVIVQSGVRVPFTDYPAPGISYYYAAIFEDDLIQGNVEIVPGRNATVQAAAIPPGGGMGPGTQGAIRSVPLPLISISNAVPGTDSYSEIPTPVPLGPEAAKAVGDIKKIKANPPALKKPRAFRRDLEPPAGGEESPLRSIVQGPFVQEDWQTCRTELLRYLSLPRSGTVEARARFYLGQVYYFSGSNREALIEFLMVQSQYPGEANEWIAAVLERIIQ
jgi:hypothetical protein